MDSVASYAKQMGLKVIHTYDQPFLQADRGNGGFIDGPNHEKKRYHFTDKDLSTREYADLLAKDGLILGRTSISILWHQVRKIVVLFHLIVSVFYIVDS